VARPKKTLTPEELKVQRENLRAVLKKITADRKEAETANAKAVKELDTAKKAADKAVAAAQKAADKTMKDAMKAFEAQAKHARKRIEAADKGIEKLTGQLAALQPAAPSDNSTVAA
jgi:chromosome segregation ATPase